MSSGLRSTMRVAALVALLAGLAACAKYPAVVTAGATPSTTVPAPVPPR
jgi:hypothetical protein